MKLSLGAGAISAESVAPYVGAWIETDVFRTDSRRCRSHPTWVRGLKRWKSLWKNQ